MFSEASACPRGGVVGAWSEGKGAWSDGGGMYLVRRVSDQRGA